MSADWGALTFAHDCSIAFFLLECFRVLGSAPSTLGVTRPSREKT